MMAHPYAHIVPQQVPKFYLHFYCNLYHQVTVLGTPAEEGAGGKVDLIKAGAFQGMDVAMMAHPYAYTVPQPVALSMLE